MVTPMAAAAMAAELLPPGRYLRRAREWYLYDQQGDRYLDFWQGRGAAFLGHRPPGLARTVKEEIDRGLWSPAPTRWPYRLEKVLMELSAVADVPSLTLEPRPLRWWPLAGVVAEASSLQVGSAATAAVQVVPPGVPGTGTPESPVLLAAAVVGLQALLRYLQETEAHSESARRVELAGTIACPPGYRRLGVAFFPDPDETGRVVGRYDANRRTALELGFVLPPTPGEPIICPGVLGRRELRNWEVLNDRWS